jgi:hypothetical protein
MFIERPLSGYLEVLRMDYDSVLDMMVSDEEIHVIYWQNGLIFISFAGGEAFTGRLFIEMGSVPGKAGTA